MTDFGPLAIIAATVVAACAAGWWMDGVDIWGLTAPIFPQSSPLRACGASQ
jgi:hypothetical protein